MVLANLNNSITGALTIRSMPQHAVRQRTETGVSSVLRDCITFLKPSASLLPIIYGMSFGGRFSEIRPSAAPRIRLATRDNLSAQRTYTGISHCRQAGKYTILNPGYSVVFCSTYATVAIARDSPFGIKREPLASMVMGLPIAV